MLILATFFYFLFHFKSHSIHQILRDLLASDANHVVDILLNLIQVKLNSKPNYMKRSGTRFSNFLLLFKITNSYMMIEHVKRMCCEFLFCMVIMLYSLC